MVDLSAYLDPGDGEPPGGAGDEDLEALKACLKALADAIASTNPRGDHRLSRRCRRSRRPCAGLSGCLAAVQPSLRCA